MQRRAGPPSEPSHVTALRGLRATHSERASERGMKHDGRAHGMWTGQQRVQRWAQQRGRGGGRVAGGRGRLRGSGIAAIAGVAAGWDGDGRQAVREAVRLSRCRREFGPIHVMVPRTPRATARCNHKPPHTEAESTSGTKTRIPFSPSFFSPGLWFPAVPRVRERLECRRTPPTIHPQ